ncbi:hypothetical protein BDZ94DRAFT_1267525 [Collybia nuda]|uniref:Uncharacterized protein n=1 Tax=Collybia nuda TaxID=64659 RepID=A0A9P5Y1W3_9AGAR|nr:hypothetical protein BDZ94DRAFT_1267525 [Collybia nuda]
MISSTVSFLLASLVLNNVSTSLAAPIRYDYILIPLNNVLPFLGSHREIMLMHWRQEHILQDGKKPGTIDLISTTTTVVEKGKGKSSCSGRPAPKKSCGKKVNKAKPGKKCGKKTGPVVPSSGTNSTTVPPGPSNDNSTVTPDGPPPGSSNSTSTPPTMQSLPILPDGPTDSPLSNGTVLVQDPNNSNSTTAIPSDAPEPQPVRRRASSVTEPVSGSEPPKAREVKQRLDKRNRMSLTEA